MNWKLPVGSTNVSVGLTVDSILADISRKIDQLNQVAAQQQKVVDMQTAAITRASERRDAAAAEKERALSVAAKFSELMK